MTKLPKKYKRTNLIYMDTTYLDLKRGNNMQRDGDSRSTNDLNHISPISDREK